MGRTANVSVAVAGEAVSGTAAKLRPAPGCGPPQPNCADSRSMVAIPNKAWISMVSAMIVATGWAEDTAKQRSSGHPDDWKKVPDPMLRFR